MKELSGTTGRTGEIFFDWAQLYSISPEIKEIKEISFKTGPLSWLSYHLAAIDFGNPRNVCNLWPLSN